MRRRTEDGPQGGNVEVNESRGRDESEKMAAPIVILEAVDESQESSSASTAERLICPHGYASGWHRCKMLS